MRRHAFLLCLLAALPGRAQLSVWAEEFENNCTQNCLATSYAGVNGAWTTMVTGINGTCANRWFISCQENGNPVGTCGSGCGNNETLHIGNASGSCTSPNSCFFCPTGDCGAAYDASCPAGLCSVCCSCQSSQTDVRAVSPPINLLGWSSLTLRFKYMEGGSTTVDNAVLDYYDGTGWIQLADMPKTPTGGCGPQGTWTSYSISLPSSANNNPVARIGFRWVNNDDGVGTDPSIAIDDVEVLAPYVAPGTGLIVNELSNGPSGNKEYIELVAVGPGCTVDVRGVKVDDNNGVAGNGFGTLMNGSGVSTGHTAFSNAAQWAAVPTGSIILIYNNADLNVLVPPADASDTAPHDSVYVLPANSPLLTGCGTYPNGLTTSAYPSCTASTSSWVTMGYRDQGDAGQTRDAYGRYFHGISYGPAIQNMNAGGLDNLRISTASGAASVLWFNSGNFRNAANFGFGTVVGNQTPGAPNNAANHGWINSIACQVLPVELLAFEADSRPDLVRLHWRTATEQNSDHFLLDRSEDGEFFAPIAWIPAAGNSAQPVDYVHDDAAPLPGSSYYRLRQFDTDGTGMTGPVIAVVRSQGNGCSVSPFGDHQVEVVMSTTGTPWTLVDLSGRLLASGFTLGTPFRLDVPPGASFLSLDALGVRSTFRILGTSAGTLVAAADR